MLQIREEQMAAFVQSDVDAFVRRVARHLQDVHAEELSRQKLEGQPLDTLIRQGLRESGRYGVEFEGDVVRYIECMVVLGPRFDADGHRPWLREILSQVDKTGGEKMDEIELRLLFGSPER